MILSVLNRLPGKCLHAQKFQPTIEQAFNIMTIVKSLGLWRGHIENREPDSHRKVVYKKCSFETLSWNCPENKPKDDFQRAHKLARKINPKHQPPAWPVKRAKDACPNVWCSGRIRYLSEVVICAQSPPIQPFCIN